VKRECQPLLLGMPTSLLEVMSESESMCGCSLKRTIWIQSISNVALGYIYSSDVAQIRSFRVDERESNTAWGWVTYWAPCFLHTVHYHKVKSKESFCFEWFVTVGLRMHWSFDVAHFWFKFECLLLIISRFPQYVIWAIIQVWPNTLICSWYHPMQFNQATAG